MCIIQASDTAPTTNLTINLLQPDDRCGSATDRAKREGERGAEQLLDGGAECHPGPLPAPQGQDEQVQGRASEAPGRTYPGTSRSFARRPRNTVRPLPCIAERGDHICAVFAIYQTLTADAVQRYI